MPFGALLLEFLNQISVITGLFGFKVKLKAKFAGMVTKSSSAAVSIDVVGSLSISLSASLLSPSPLLVVVAAGSVPDEAEAVPDEAGASASSGILEITKIPIFSIRFILTIINNYSYI